MYSIIIFSMGFFLNREHLNFQEVLKIFREWVEDNSNAYSFFFFIEVETGQGKHFYKKADGTMEELTSFGTES